MVSLKTGVGVRRINRVADRCGHRTSASDGKGCQKCFGFGGVPGVGGRVPLGDIARMRVSAPDLCDGGIQDGFNGDFHGRSFDYLAGRAMDL